MSEFEDKINSVLSDPEQMAKITRLASTLMGGETSEQPKDEAPDSGIFSRLGSLFGGDKKDESAAPTIDEGTLRRLTAAFSSQKSDKLALCSALAPYLSPARRDKLTKAVRFARLASVAGIMFREGGDGKNV